MKWNKFKIQPHEEKNRWKYFSIWKSSKIFIWCCFRGVISAEKKSDVGLYGSVVGRGAGEVPVDLGGPAIEMLICIEPMVGRGADGIFVWSDLIRSGGGPAVEKIDLYGAGDKKGCWRGPSESAVDFDAYGAIFIHSFHYSSPYFSFVEFIFFNCVLIFSRPRRGPMMINFIWWFRYDPSPAVQKEGGRSTTMK